MKDYIESGIKELFDTNKNVIVMESPKILLGDYCVQCSNLRDNNYKNPIQIADYIKDNFDDKDNLFSDIKVVGPYVNFYLNYDRFTKNVILEIEDKQKNMVHLIRVQGSHYLLNILQLIQMLNHILGE